MQKLISFFRQSFLRFFPILSNFLPSWQASLLRWAKGTRHNVNGNGCLFLPSGVGRRSRRQFENRLPQKSEAFASHDAILANGSFDEPWAPLSNGSKSS